MQGFKSPGHAQRFLSAYGPIAQHVRPRRHRLPVSEYRRDMAQRFQIWQDMMGTVIAASGPTDRQLSHLAHGDTSPGTSAPDI
jgi:hypothetical protein